MGGLTALITGVALVILLPVLASAQPPQLVGFDDYVAAAMKEWEVPGMAVAIVKDGEVVICKGYGVRKLGENAPVDENTLFRLDSASKPFGAAVIGILTDEEKMAWDDPVIRYMPDFQLHDPWVTREVTIRDLLCHRTGLPSARGDMLLAVATAGRDQVISRLRYLEPESSFRASFGYSNTLYMVAGEVAARAAGASWDDLVAQRIFRPLAMDRSGTRTQLLEQDENRAAAHVRGDDGRLREAPTADLDLLGPAGSIFSSAADMAKWILMHLNEGKVGETQLIQPDTLREMQTRQVSVPVHRPVISLGMEEDPQVGYGLGWVICNYVGRKVVWHTGGDRRSSAIVALMPAEKLGLVVLSNHPDLQLLQALSWRIFDACLERPGRDWAGEALGQRRKAIQAEQAALAELQEARAKNTSPSLPLEAYAGVYSSKLYGPATVSHANGVLTIAIGSLPGVLHHWHYDVFHVLSEGGLTTVASLDTFAHFSIDEQGKVGTMELEGIGRFERVPPGGSSDPQG